MKSKRLANLLVGSLLLAGSCITTALLQAPQAYAGSFNIIGEWTGSPDCQINFLDDDGTTIEGNCDNGSFNHIIQGSYSTKDPNRINITVTRIDYSTGCKTSVRGYIRVIDNDNVRFWQEGWHGCGVNTAPATSTWTRLE